MAANGWKQSSAELKRNNEQYLEPYERKPNATIQLSQLRRYWQCVYLQLYVRLVQKRPNEEEKQLNDLQEDRKIDPVSSRGWK